MTFCSASNICFQRLVVRFVISVNRMKNFKELKIWQKGINIATQSFRLVQTFPKEERFGLSLQITRAAVSIASNIAEGSSRSSDKDYHRFLEMAQGSIFELETQLIIASQAEFGDIDLRESILKAINEEQRMLAAFMRQLQNKSAKACG